VDTFNGVRGNSDDDARYNLVVSEIEDSVREIKEKIRGINLSRNNSSIADLFELHTVIVFNNRGIGNTTSGSEQFSIEQLQMILLDY
jgi:hypothetical protein